MRDYGKVAPTFWTRGSGKMLRGHPHAQVLALYLFTAPAASMIGLYYVALPTMCHETGLSEAMVRDALGHLSKAEIAYYDESAELVWVPEMARYQIGDDLRAGDKRIKGVIRELASFRSHRFGVEFVRRYNQPFSLGESAQASAPVAPAPSKDLGTPLEAPPKPLRSQDQDQEHDQEQNTPSCAGVRASQEEGHEEQPNDETAAAILAIVQRYSQLRELVTVHAANTLALAGVEVGLTAEETIDAVRTGAAKKAAGLGDDGCSDPEKVRMYLAGCITGAAKDKKNINRPRGPASSDPMADLFAREAMEQWQATYRKSKRRYGEYTPAPNDERAIAELAAHATGIARDRKPDTATPVAARALLQQWFEAYLRDDGNKGIPLAERRHPLCLLKGFVSSYGTPWDKPAVSSPAYKPLPKDTTPTPASEEVAKNLKGALGKLRVVEGFVERPIARAGGAS